VTSFPSSSRAAERLLTIELTLATEPPREWRLEVLPEGSRSQADHLAAWLEPARR
jgi:hypothetical protein